MNINRIIHNLEYAAFNLCEKTDDDIEQGVIDSTCPETSLFIAIRELKQPSNQVDSVCAGCFCCGYSSVSNHNYCFNCGRKLNQD